MTYLLGKNVSIGQKILLDKRYKITETNDEGVTLSNGLVLKFGSTIRGRKFK